MQYDFNLNGSFTIVSGFVRLCFGNMLPKMQLATSFSNIIDVAGHVSSLNSAQNNSYESTAET